MFIQQLIKLNTPTTIILKLYIFFVIILYVCVCMFFVLIYNKYIYMFCELRVLVSSYIICFDI